MKRYFLCILAILIIGSISAQNYSYEASEAFPFGQKNPKAPEQLKDFAPLIGECDCISETRKADGNWNGPGKMTWRFKYIMNGMAVQDETLKDDGRHSGSIRQFNTDSLKWYVHYYSSVSAVNNLPSWEGGKTDIGSIVLYREQKAPNGMEGFYRLTFYDISNKGYKWIGEWVSTDETIVYPTWKISCTRKED
ncbi:hypothetical protein GWK08_17450 [Leptobacterium flavescens]|uniref:DUF1579 domain-containing protein n=1 Tax=Leptobacterium flavescens TaxID=472055 RepID=A0A6P0UXR2_9FLAO|nr:hypothetical protein [Leptobacterium flavescens]NER15246.1 hypothetical protein [Leptobacterium flavescens]